MKRFARLCCGLTLILALAGLAWAATEMSVQVRDGQVRKSPSFLGPILAKLPYGTKVTVNEEKGDWYKVSSGAALGWMHVSALSDEELELSAGEGAPDSVSGSEVALAGKGFNEKVEAEYRQSHGQGYALVDKMEKDSIPAEKLTAFLKKGGLAPNEER